MVGQNRDLGLVAGRFRAPEARRIETCYATVSKANQRLNDNRHTVLFHIVEGKVLDVHAASASRASSRSTWMPSDQLIARRADAEESCMMRGLAATGNGWTARGFSLAGRSRRDPGRGWGQPSRCRRREICGGRGGLRGRLCPSSPTTPPTPPTPPAAPGPITKQGRGSYSTHRGPQRRSARCKVRDRVAMAEKRRRGTYPGGGAAIRTSAELDIARTSLWRLENATDGCLLQTLMVEAACQLRAAPALRRPWPADAPSTASLASLGTCACPPAGACTHLRFRAASFNATPRRYAVVKILFQAIGDIASDADLSSVCPSGFAPYEEADTSYEVLRTSYAGRPESDTS